MLKKSKRLTSGDIEGLSQGKSVFGTLISLRIAPAQETKVSITVPKKVLSRAVDRVRARRRLYSAVETVFSRISPSAHITVTPKKECLIVSFENLIKEVSDTLKKARLLG